MIEKLLALAIATSTTLPMNRPEKPCHPIGWISWQTELLEMHAPEAEYGIQAIFQDVFENIGIPPVTVYKFTEDCGGEAFVTSDDGVFVLNDYKAVLDNMAKNYDLFEKGEITRFEFDQSLTGRICKEEPKHMSHRARSISDYMVQYTAAHEGTHIFYWDSFYRFCGLEPATTRIQEEERADKVAREYVAEHGKPVGVLLFTYYAYVNDFVSENHPHPAIRLHNHIQYFKEKGLIKNEFDWMMEK